MLNRTFKPTARHLLAALMLTMPVLFAPGCGTSISGLCRRALECEGDADNEDELDACVESVKDLEERAQDDGCGDEFDAWLGCVDDNLECDGDDAEVDGCEGEDDDLDDCLDDDDVSSSASCGGWSCDGDGACICQGGPNDGAACCDDSVTTCETVTCGIACCS
jgi:hypothetical protein